MPFFEHTRLHPLPPSSPAAPPAFPYPHHYRPDALAQRAAKELRDYLEQHRIGRGGKMFGVLVVRATDGTLGYLAGYSGKLSEEGQLPGFVPPVFDVLDPKGFYRAGEGEVAQLSEAVERTENDPEYRDRGARLRARRTRLLTLLADLRRLAKSAKKNRAERRSGAAPAEREQLVAESLSHQFFTKVQRKRLEERLGRVEAELAEWAEQLTRLRRQRAALSHSLQQRIFASYSFLNARGERRSLDSIFADTAFRLPPAGAGDCAAPKLLQYAYEHGLAPVTMAEFWWGAAPPSAVRHHGQYYPACRGKCQPILAHMLGGVRVAPNPLLENPAAGKTLTDVYEDEHLIVVDKPAEFLSVPGREIEDSVYTRLRERFPRATGPLVVHRLDMSTSGLLLLAKDKGIHEALQRQFVRRTVGKRYVASLTENIDGVKGRIDLPLAADVTDRPRQIVDIDRGKSAVTYWEVALQLPTGSVLHLWPQTGRTHQLRVHCAHASGLGAPIIGDDLYGSPADRLHLHAAELVFDHPATGRRMLLTAPPPFLPADRLPAPRFDPR